MMKDTEDPPTDSMYQLHDDVDQEQPLQGQGQRDNSAMTRGDQYSSPMTVAVDTGDPRTSSKYHVHNDEQLHQDQNQNQNQPLQQPDTSAMMSGSTISPMTTTDAATYYGVTLSPPTSPDRTATTTSGNESSLMTPQRPLPQPHRRRQPQHHHGKAKEVVVLVKSYYVSHSLRVPSLRSPTKPEVLTTLSATTWFEIQAQLEPLVKRHLCLPKSYLFVPIWCIVAAVGWFICFSIAAAKAAMNSSSSSSNYNYQQDYNDDQYATNVNNYDNYYYNDYYSSFATQTAAPSSNSNLTPVSMIFWTGLYFVLLTLVWIICSRWIARKNQPVDDELREVCMELSRSKTQSEGYRLEYAKANYDSQDPFRNDLFATRVLRFVPLPIPTNISVPNTPTREKDPHAKFRDTPYMMEATILRQNSTMSASSGSSEYPTLQSLSSTDFAPFPATDRIMENLVSLLFVLVIFQCVNSLP
jgi:hypothetical protein